MYSCIRIKFKNKKIKTHFVYYIKYLSLFIRNKRQLNIKIKFISFLIKQSRKFVILKYIFYLTRINYFVNHVKVKTKTCLSIQIKSTEKLNSTVYRLN